MSLAMFKEADTFDEVATYLLTNGLNEDALEGARQLWENTQEFSDPPPQSKKAKKSKKF